MDQKPIVVNTAKKSSSCSQLAYLNLQEYKDKGLHMVNSAKMRSLAVVVATSTATAAAAFQSSIFAIQQTRHLSNPTSLRMATVDPMVITNKEYEDICGADFTPEELAKRLMRTSYLYPKHVEVIEDLEPIVNKMVDEVVSRNYVLSDDISYRVSTERI